jgi:hypothetical protein
MVGLCEQDNVTFVCSFREIRIITQQMFVEQEANWHADNCKHHYFITIYNQQHFVIL